jgi:hypothetical protein
LLTLRYEDISADPRAAFHDVVRFLGEDPAPERLEQAIAFSSFESLRAQECERGFRERPPALAAFFRSGRSGGWRDVLTPAQAARIERDHGREMARFAYI